MSTELIVLRAFIGDQAVAEEMLARGFAPDLMTSRQGRQVAETLLSFRENGTIPSLENVRQALERRGRLGGGFRQYLTWLERMPCCTRLHAVAHLQMLKLDQVMARVDNICQRVTAQVGEDGATDKSPYKVQAQVGAPTPVPSVSQQSPGTGPASPTGLRPEETLPRPRAEA